MGGGASGPGQAQVGLDRKDSPVNEQEFVEIFIQQATTGQWLNEQGAWVAEQRQAKVFDCTVEALDYCRNHRISDAQLDFVFADPQFNFVIPVATSQPKVSLQASASGSVSGWFRQQFYPAHSSR